MEDDHGTGIPQHGTAHLIGLQFAKWAYNVRMVLESTVEVIGDCRAWQLPINVQEQDSGSLSLCWAGGTWVTELQQHACKLEYALTP